MHKIAVALAFAISIPLYPQSQQKNTAAQVAGVELDPIQTESPSDQKVPDGPTKQAASLRLVGSHGTEQSGYLAG